MKAAGLEVAGELAEMRSGPLFGSPAAAGEKEAKGAGGDGVTGPGFGGGVDGQRNGGRGERETTGLAEKVGVLLNDMDAVAREALAIEAGGECLAGVSETAEAGGVGEAAEDGRPEGALEVDDEVEVGGEEVTAECGDGAEGVDRMAGGGLPEAGIGKVNLVDDGPGDAGMCGEEGGPASVDEPVYGPVGAGEAEGGDSGEGVEHVAERADAGDEDFQMSRASTARRVCSSSMNSTSRATTMRGATAVRRAQWPRSSLTASFSVVTKPVTPSFLAVRRRRSMSEEV